jgi:hypothetical protein
LVCEVMAVDDSHERASRPRDSTFVADRTPKLLTLFVFH